jgi:hypothetical protein
MSSAIAMLTADPRSNIGLRDRVMNFFILSPPSFSGSFYEPYLPQMR